jgi:hypothetical protein
MTKPLPSLFVFHGAPDIVLHHSAAREFLSNFDGRLGHNGSKPKAILIATAHFETAAPQLTADDRPGMIYDCAGFDARLYDMHYPAPGAAETRPTSSRSPAQSRHASQDRCRPRLRPWYLGAADAPFSASGYPDRAALGATPGGRRAPFQTWRCARAVAR